jgi:hypothetical protein
MSNTSSGSIAGSTLPGGAALKIYGSADPAGGSPLGALPRRTAVLALSNRAPVAAPGK